MILLFNNYKITRPVIVNTQISTEELFTRDDSRAFISAPKSFSATNAWISPVAISNTFNYPISIEELFPYWLRKQSAGITGSLIQLTTMYYDWLTCNSGDVNNLSFLNLESIIDINSIPKNLVTYISQTYFNAFPSSKINNGVDSDFIKNIINNIKINLYSLKGTDSSYKLLFHDLYGISSENVSISYPKNFVMRLNGGVYDWMIDEVRPILPKSFTPDLTKSYLNFSVIQDNDLWQDYSYVVNISTSPSQTEVTYEDFESTIKPVVHPLGMLDFYNIRNDIFDENNISYGVATSELTVIDNYRTYVLGSTQSQAVCFDGAGTTPIYVFPSWDKQISAKYILGMSFGSINIGDFLTLTSPDNNKFDYPNEERVATICQ